MTDKISMMDSSIQITASNPYPGLAPFGEDDSAFFYGREAEQAELLRLVKREPLTVLYGQSGLGKTSLLHAVLFPRLREARYLPVAFRLNFDPGVADLLEPVHRAITAALTAQQVDASPPDPTLTLWEYLHRTPWWDQRNQLLTPVLVFDQFEELFTLGRNDPRTTALLEQLADLCENRIPAAVRARLEQGESLDFDYDPPNYRIVLSLREDFLPDLDDLRTLMPSLLRNRMRLLPLNGEQALDAVAKPGEQLLSLSIAEEIVRFVAGAGWQTRHFAGGSELKELTVEPALLSLVCYQLNQQRLRQDQPIITADLLRGSKERLLADFYERCTADQNPAVRRFIEERLLTASGFRRAEAVDDALRNVGVTNAAITTLIDRRLLRREDRFGEPHIELIHDVLTGTVQASRDRRREREAMRRRRRRWLLGAATAGGVAILAIASTLIYANLYHQSEENLQRAERHRQGAKKLINFMVFDLRDNLENVGQLDLLEQPAQRALEYFSQLPETEMTPDALRQRESALDTIGDVFKAKGNLNQALTAYQQSLDIAQRLIAQDPANTTWQRDLMVSHSRVGTVLEVQKDLEAALKAYRQALEIMQRLAEHEPSNSQWQRELAASHNDVGDVLEAQGQLEAALAAYRQAQEIMQRLVAQEPSNSQWQQALAAIHNKIDKAFNTQESGEDVLKNYQQALENAQRQAAQNPLNRQWQWYLANSYDIVGNELKSRQQWGEALAAYQQALEIRLRLATRPGSLQQAIVTNHLNIGEVLKAQGQHEAALAAYRQALEIQQRLAAQDPSNSDWQRGLVASHLDIGEVLEAQQQWDAALAAYRQALEIQQRLASQDSTNANWQYGLVLVYQRLGNVLQKQTKLAEAEQAYRQALTIDQQLIERGRSDVVCQHCMGVIESNLGDVLKAQTNLTGAEAAYRQALEIQQRLVAQNPSDSERQQALAVSHFSIGKVLEAQGQHEAALAAYRQALEIRQRLAAQDPSNSDWQRGLVAIHFDIGEVLEAQQQWDAALAAYRQALEIGQCLVAKDSSNADWQYGVVLIYQRLGSVLQAQAKPGEAEKAFRQALEIQQHLAAREPSNNQWQLDLAVTYRQLSNLQRQQGNTRDALGAEMEALKIAREHHAKQQDDASQQFLAETLGGLSFTLLFDHQFSEAITAAEEALALDPNKLWIATNQAHGYLLLGQFEKAEAIYRQHAQDRANDRQTFVEAVLDDFAQLRREGIDHPDMKKIEAMYQNFLSKHEPPSGE